jgi:hypothetical protein
MVLAIWTANVPTPPGAPIIRVSARHGGERQVDGDAAGAEVDEADEGFGSVEAVAAVADEPDLGVQSLKPRVAQSEVDGGEDAVLVFADCAGELDERLELGA